MNMMSTPAARAAAGAVVFLLAFGSARTATAQDTGGAGAVSGVVLSASGTGELAITVCLVGTIRCAVTDDRGQFRLADVRPGSYELEVTPPGSARVRAGQVEVRAGLDTRVSLTLPAVASIVEKVTVTAGAFVTAEEIKTSGFLIQRREIQSSAGALQDVSRYVQALPGVSPGAVDFRNDLVVRGGSPLENLFIVDNIEIPNINAFANFSSAGGTVSLIDSAVIEDVTFLTGGFPAAYGSRVSSVLQIAKREGSRERFSARATLGFAGAGTVLEGPLASGRGSWLLSFRRTFLDFFTNDVGIGGVPVVYTLNGKVVMDLTPRDRIWGVTISGKDRIRLGLTEGLALDEPLADFDIQYRGWRSANGFNWQRLLSRGVGLLGVSHSVASVNSRVKDLLSDGIPAAGTPVDEAIAAGPVVFREESRESETTVKYDLTTYLGASSKVQSGAAVKVFGLNYDTGAPRGSDSPFAVEPGVNAFSLRNSLRTYQLGAYAQASTRIGARTSVTWGARVDRFAYLEATRFAPRLGVTVKLNDRVSWNASAGRYFQQPPFLFLTAFPSNSQLDPQQADHVVTGLSVQPSALTRFSIEGYYKRYTKYPVSIDFPSLSLANVGDTFNTRDVLFPMSSDGRGQATGVELMAERKPGGRWYGQANLSFSRARHAGLDGVLRAGSYDSPIVANADGGVRWPSGWLVTSRVAFYSGRPYTPIDEAASAAAGRSVFDLRAVNGKRAPNYFRLDLRLERTLSARGGDVTIYGGVQNLTNRRNFAGYYWSRRSNSVVYQEQLGIFPILGFEWRF